MADIWVRMVRLQGADSLTWAQKRNADLRELKLPTYILDLVTAARFSGVLKERCVATDTRHLQRMHVHTRNCSLAA